VSVGPAADARLLTTELVRVAELARGVIPPESIAQGGIPEHVLIRGALAALAWRSEFKVLPPLGDPSWKHVDPSSSQIRADGIAYLKVGGHAEGVTVRFRKALSRSGGVRGVVLDLRGSQDGLYEESLALIDLFTRQGCLVVTRPPPAFTAHQTARAQPGDIDSAVVVLIDPQTSADAELVAETLRSRGHRGRERRRATD
jgi:hypothetical protein